MSVEAVPGFQLFALICIRCNEAGQPQRIQLSMETVGSRVTSKLLCLDCGAYEERTGESAKVGKR